MMSLREVLIAHEGWKKYPYKDSRGIWTIGVGHNMQNDPEMMMHLTKLQAEGMSDDQISALLTEDIARHESDLTTRYFWVTVLSPARLDAMINLTFNLGIRKLGQFVHFLQAMKEGNWEQAVIELLGTKEHPTPYHMQVGHRAEFVADQIIKG